MTKYRIRALCAVLLLGGNAGCFSRSTEVVTWTQLREENPSAVVLVVQLGDCTSRAADIRLVGSLARFDAVAILTDEAPTAEQIHEIESVTGGVKYVLLPQEHGLLLRALGLAATPAVISWSEKNSTTVVFPLSTNRAVLLRQVHQLQAF